MSKRTKSVKRKITNICSPFERIQIGFINQMGGYDFWYFNQQSKRSVQVDRNEFTKVLSPTYNVGDRGRTIYSVVGKDMWQANTDFLSEYDYAFLEQLILTSEAYWIKWVEAEQRNRPYPIIITDKTYEIKTKFKDKLFKVTLSFEMAFDKNTISQ